MAKYPVNRIFSFWSTYTELDKLFVLYQKSFIIFKIENEIFILYKIPIFKVVNVTRNFSAILRKISYKKVLNVQHNFNFSLLSVFLGRLRSICVKIEKLTSLALDPLINVKVEIIMCTALSPPGYKKRTGQFLRALHIYSIDNFVAFWLKWL